MNRLKKIAFGKTLYHGTSLEKFKQIISSGMLMPQESVGSGIGPDYDPDNSYDERLEKNFEGFSFFATTLSRAFMYANNDSGSDYYNPPVVIEFDISEDALQPDDNDSPYANTWQDSNESINQVKVLGPISTEYIRRVHFYKFNGKRVFIATLSDWEVKLEENKQKFEQVTKQDKFDSSVDEEKVKFIKDLKDNGIVIDETTFIMKNPSLTVFLPLYLELRTKESSVGSIIKGFIRRDGNIEMQLNGFSNNEITKDGGDFYLTYNIITDNISAGWNLEDFYSNVYATNPGVMDNMRIVLGSMSLMVYVDGVKKLQTVDQIQQQLDTFDSEGIKTANCRLKKLIK